MPILMICRYIVTWMLVLSRLCCSDSDTLLVLLVDGCPQNDSGSIHQIKDGADLVYSGRQQLSFIDSTQFVEKPEGVSTAFFIHFDYFVGGYYKLGSWEAPEEVKPQPPKNQALFIEDDIVLVGNCITPVHTVRDSGVMLDSKMIMSHHVMRVCQNCYF